MARLRAAGALAVLLALLVAVPAGLAGTIGNPTAGFGDLLVGDVTDTALIGLLAGVAWLAWAQFAFATVVELFAAARGIRAPMPIPGVLSGQQQLARTLVAAVFLLGPAAASATLSPGGLAYLPAPTPATVSLPAVSLSAASTPSGQGASTADTGLQTAGSAPVDRGPSPAARPAGDAGTVVYVVPAAGQGPVTLWDIAEARLGSGERWQEIWALNEGREQPGGATFRVPGRLLPGWTVLVPGPATGGPGGARQAGDVHEVEQVQSEVQEVVVEPGDTLSELAAEHGQQSWQPMWQANAGRDEPGGARFNDPDLIRPGWRLSIPAAASGASTTAAPAPVAPGSPAAAPAPATASPTSPAITAPAPSMAAPAPTASSDQAATTAPETTAPDDAGPAATDPATPTAPSAPSAPSSSQQPAPAPPAAADPGDASTVSDWPRQVAFTGSGVLLAAVTLEGLRRLRRRQFRDRALGRTIGATPAAIAPMEKALLVRGAAGAPDVQWLSTALRSLAQRIAADPAASLPDVVAVRLGPDALELVLTTAATAAPAPWRADASGLRWSLRRHEELPVELSAGARDVSAPYPTLATVGHSPDGDHWLLDLERVGALSLTGDRAGCENLARYLAAELTHNAWSDQLLVTLVGFGAELAGLNPARVLHQADLAQATRDARATLRETTQVLAQAETSVLDGRLRPHLVGDGWSPHVLLVAPGQQPAAATAGLAALLADVRAQRSRTAVAVVLAGDTEHHDATRWQLHVGADGVLSLPELDLRLQAAQLPAEEAADLAALLALAAQGPDAAMPLRAGDEPWEAFVDAAGALRPGLARPREQPPAGPVRPAAVGEPVGGAEQAGTLLPETVHSYLGCTATTAEDVAALAPVVDPEVRRQVEQADPSLDEDLRLWHDPGSGIAKLTVLGPVNISACAGAPSNLRRDRVVEVVAYLACRPQGVSTEQWIAQMWPGEAGVPDSRPRAYANSARHWLGKDPRTGQDYLPRATEGQGKVGSYRLRGVLIDADLFRRLRLRASARGADGLADLEAALTLVSGEPLSRLRASGGAWLVDTPVQHHYTAMVVDVAHLVATAHLAVGDPAGAERAAQVSLLTGSRDDVALLDLVAVHDAAGEHTQADRYVARILANHDADVEEDLPPRTYEVLRRRQWLPTRDARAS